MSELIYTDTSRVIPGIPARDLTADEVEEYGGEEYLLATGLYSKPDKKKKSAADKDGE